MYCKFFGLLMGIVTLLLSSLTSYAQTDSIYKIQSAGIQFLVPAGWETAKTSDGDVVVFTEKGTVMVTFMVGGDYKQIIAGLTQGLKTQLTDYKVWGNGTPSPTQNINGISTTEYLSGEGTLIKTPVRWYIRYWEADKPIVMYWFGLKEPYGKRIKQASSITSSVKKIENQATTPSGGNSSNPNVVMNAETGKLAPAIGYAWLDPSNPKDLRVVLMPGLTIDKVGNFRTAEGYRWLNPSDSKDLRVEQPLGRIENIKYNLVVQRIKIGAWTCLSLSEFESFKITDINITSGRIEYKADIILKDIYYSGKRFSANLVVLYRKLGNEWIISVTDNNSLHELK